MALTGIYIAVGRNLRNYYKSRLLFPAVVASGRNFSPSVRSMASSISQQFEDAKNKSGSLQSDPGNEVKLKMYALFKQSTMGKCNAKQPGVFDIVGRAKWSAWSALGEMSQEDAQKEYIRIVDDLAAGDRGSAASASASSSTDASADQPFKTLLVTQDGAVKKIVLNRADKKNAINLDMYAELKQVLSEAGKDTETLVTVITGAGDFYCSGNDLGNFASFTSTGDSMSEMARKGGELLRDYVSSFIDFPKILVALVNGPAVGISVTVLGLFDMVLASDRATFHTPFSMLGQSPEGVSSLMFPALMGSMKANEMLLFNRKLTAREAETRGLVTEVFADHCFQKEAWEKIKYIASLPPQSVLLSKKLIRGRLIDKFHEVNRQECELLMDRWQSDECLNAITSFMQRKAKL